MNKQNPSTILKGLRHLLNEQNSVKTPQKPESKAKPIEGITLLLSLVAVAISCFSLYFQFFYEKNELRANFISASFENDSTLTSKVIYHNKGNQYATVLTNTVVFYQDESTIDDKGVFFTKQKANQTFKEEFEPLVLTPGQQTYREIVQPFDFRNINQKETPLNFKDTIKMSLGVGYINENGMYSTTRIPMGWLLLDSNFSVKYFSVEYKSELLNSDTYRSNTYRIQK